MSATRTSLAAEVASAFRLVDEGAVPGSLETSTLDFKEFKPAGANDRDPFKRGAEDIADAAACFANAGGGTVVVGVDDDTAGSDAWVGVPIDLRADDLRHRIYSATSPSLVADVDDLDHGGRRLLFVTALPGFDLHRVKGKLRERIDDHCEPMSPEREARILEERRSFDWSAQASDATADDIVSGAMAEARRLLETAGDESSVRRSRLTDGDLLRECGLLRPEGMLNRAGALLFCEPGLAQPVAAGIQYLRKDAPGGRLSRPPLNTDTPVLPTLATVLAQIESVNETTPITLRSGVQQQVATVPSAAVREAIVNAVAHRDYRLPGVVTVEHSPQTLVVTSPGELVFGVTAANILTHVSKPRNQALATALATLRLAERAGTGADAMVRAMVRAGHGPPVFASGEERVRVVLSGGAPVARVASLIAELPDELRDDTDTALVVHHLRSHASVDPQALAPLIQKTPDEAARTLHRLTDERIALLEPVRSPRGQGPRFRFRENVRAELGTLLPYHRNQRDAVERRVIAHVREYGTISNQTTRNLFQVETVRASQILRDLTDRGIIAKTADSPQRGPGVRYEAGARFPRGRRRGPS